jgi:hypothetical protein
MGPLKIIRLLIIFLLLLTSGCSVPDSPNAGGPTFTPPPAPPQSDTPLSPPTSEKAVEVALSEQSSMSSNARVDFGLTARLELSLEPVILELTRNSSGKVYMASTRAWNDASLKDMRVCFALGQACSLDGQAWVPFQPKVAMEYPVDWLGSRLVFVSAQVRDATGGVVPIYLRYYYDTAPLVQTSYDIIGQVNASTPPEQQPAPVQTALAATRMGFPLNGSVLIEGGICCKGGAAGSTVKIAVAFDAASPSARVTEMRVSTSMGCNKDAQSLDAPWEPFMPSKSFSTTLAINWVGWYVSVQYRDELGNLSPVYCDDISLEGSPAP